MHARGAGGGRAGACIYPSLGGFWGGRPQGPVRMEQSWGGIFPHLEMRQGGGYLLLGLGG
jgi:hypothetical protein